MSDAESTVFVEFPLRGEWLAPQSPGSRVPSHGTDLLGERYAYDFVQVDWNRAGKPAYRVSLLSYLLFGVPLQSCYCWGKDVYAPFDALVTVASDGVLERPRVRLASDFAYARKVTKALGTQKDSVQAIAGNYVILERSDRVYAAFVHLRTGSVAVAVGQKVRTGDVLGKVGHSGNSMSPHLHFQLMDSGDILAARGIPCGFEEYDVFEANMWRKVHNGIPTSQQRIRFEKR